MSEVAGSGDRITVSREALRAELAQLELRLVDRLTLALEAKADQSVLDQALARIQALELSRAERVHMPDDLSRLGVRVTALERFRWGLPGLAAVLGVAGLLLALFPYIN